MERQPVIARHRVVKGFKGLQMLGIDNGKPARRSVSQGGEKKGPVDRSKGFLRGAPRSGGNSPESFQTGVISYSQGRAIGEERKSAIHSHSEEGGEALKERGLSKRERERERAERRLCGWRVLKKDTSYLAGFSESYHLSDQASSR